MSSTIYTINQMLDFRVYIAPLRVWTSSCLTVDLGQKGRATISTAHSLSQATATIIDADNHRYVAFFMVGVLAQSIFF